MNDLNISVALRSRVQERSKLLIGLVGVFLAGFIFYDDHPGSPLSLLLLVGLLSVILIIALPKRLDIATAMIIISFGTVSSLVSPIVDVPDEHVHYARSSFLSDGNLNLGNDYDKLQISTDIDVVMGQIGQPLLNNPSDQPHREETTSFPSVLMTNVYYNIGYLPQALGLKIAEVFRLTVFQSYILGRLMNVLAYALLIVIAINLASSLGQVIAVLSLVPMNIFLAGSFSQDAVTTGTLFILAGFFFSWLPEERQVTPKSFVIYTILCIIVATLKLPYILFIGLPFFLPAKKFSKLTPTQVWLMKLSSVTLLLLIAVIWYKMSGAIKAPEFVTNEYLQTTDAGRQLQEIVKHPLIYGKAVLRNISDYVLNLDSTNTFGLLTYGINRFSSLMMVFYFSLVLTNANAVRLTGWTKLGIFLVCLGIASGISVALLLSWTPVGHSVIMGVQGRYFIGLYPLIALFLLANNKALEKCRGLIKQETLLGVSIYFIVMMLLTTILRYYR